MASTHAMTPITGTNGYQQQVSIDPHQPLMLSVSNASGEIRVTGSDQAGVWVVVRRSDGNDEHDPEAIPITVNVDGNRISVHPDWGVAGGLTGLARKVRDQLQHDLNPHDWDLSKFRLNPDLNYDIRVTAPKQLVSGSKIVAKTASGLLSVHDLEADVVVATASGKVDLSKIRGAVTSNSASGSSFIEEVYGGLEANSASGSVSVNGGEAWTALRTVSGRISIERFTMKNARLATVSGAIKAVVTADNAQEYAISTVSGSVNLDLTVPAASGARMSSRSASGSAKVSGDWVADGKRSWRMGSDAPGPVFNVRTMSGSLTSVGRLDASLESRNELLPTGSESDDDASEGATISGQGGRTETGGFDVDVNVDNVTNWAKDFARDFKKNFADLGTPPAPPTPPAPVAPDPPAPPSYGDDTSTAPIPDQPCPDQPWTWSTGSGSMPPTTPGSTRGEQPTAPIEAPPTAAVPGKDPPATGDMDTERLRVLEALERGDIDIDEALTRLDNDDAQGA